MFKNILKIGHIKRLATETSNWSAAARVTIAAWLRAQWSALSLKHEDGPARALAAGGLVAVVPFYGSTALLPSFLDYHRRLGVDAFVFLDLSPQGGLSARLAGQRDCAIWRPTGEPDPRRAIFWLNYLRARYATGRWCLSIEITDRFVFARSETRSIKDLTDFLETEFRNHIYALVVEMYGDRPAAAIRLKPADDPLGTLPYFDPFGYSTAPRSGRFYTMLVRGGVQRRTLFRDTPRRAPVLNRIPLVKWRWNYSYVAGTRLLMPRELNMPHAPWHSTPTACLLRFALLDPDANLAAAAKAEAAEIVADGGGRAYARVPDLRGRPIKLESSQPFLNSWSLVECGLLNPGQWF
jgi:glycosyl transferase family 2